MLSPEEYRLTRSLASVWRSAPTIRRPFSVLVVVPVAAMLIPHVPIERSWRSHLLDRLRRSCARYHLDANRHACLRHPPDTLMGREEPAGERPTSRDDRRYIRGPCTAPGSVVVARSRRRGA